MAIFGAHIVLFHFWSPISLDKQEIKCLYPFICAESYLIYIKNLKTMIEPDGRNTKERS